MKADAFLPATDYCLLATSLHSSFRLPPSSFSSGASVKKSGASKCVAGARALAEAARLSVRARRALAVGFSESVYFAFRAGGGGGRRSNGARGFRRARSRGGLRRCLRLLRL